MSDEVGVFELVGRGILWELHELQGAGEIGQRWRCYLERPDEFRDYFRVSVSTGDGSRRFVVRLLESGVSVLVFGRRSAAWRDLIRTEWEWGDPGLVGGVCADVVVLCESY